MKKVEKKEEDKKVMQYADFPVRIAAFAIDFLVLILISVVVAIIFVVLNWALKIGFDIETVSSFAGFLINAGYYIFTTYYYGATVGKKVFGIQVVSTKDAKMDIGSVIVREVAGKFLSTMFFGLGYIWIIFDKKNQGLHDKLASTAVVYKKEKIKRWKVYLTAASFLVFSVGLFFWVLSGVLDEDFQEELNQSQVVEMVNKTLNTALLCSSENNKVISPISKIGGGDVCSEEIGTTWPKLGAGYEYGNISNTLIIIEKDNSPIIECNIENSSCRLIED